jgi:hypothetical protein
MPERRYITLFLSIVLYVLSMCFVVFYGKTEAHMNAYGLPVFIMGAIYIFLAPEYSTLILFLIWLSNPLLWLAWIFIKRPKRSFYLSLISSLLALSFVIWIYSDVTLGPAYFLWLASSLTVLIGSLSMLKIVKS